MNKISLGKKILFSGLALMLLLVVLFVLNRTASNGRRTTSYLPSVSDTPVYIEMSSGESFNASLYAKEDMNVSAIRLFIVNISSESKGSFSLVLKDDTGNNIANTVIPVSDIESGQWCSVACEAFLTKGLTYKLSLLADGCDPYFMLLPIDAHDSFPYSVLVDGEEGTISLGIDTVTEISLKFGDILYFSVPFSILAFICVILFIWGQGVVLSFIGKIKFRDLFDKYGCDIFLILEAIVLSLGVYYRGYLNNIFITSDSSNYLREAVNITKGYGYSYDGLSGYESWFASWPIVYPLLIAIVMLISGTEAYLASKILTILLICALLIIFRILFKKDAWIYGLILLNAGFVELSHYTWSEIPFLIFILLYGVALGRILENDIPKIKDYILLGVTALLCFLTRYYGLFVFFVAGLYLIILFKKYIKEKDKKTLNKLIGITVNSFISGVLCVLYLLLNRIKNGYASGVSRTLWWDDYEILTNDLISSLLKEFFNIFSLKIPGIIEGFSYPVKLWVVWLIIIGLIVIIYKPVRKLNQSAVFIVMGIIYYVMFVAIRYMSSMDTFYFRFFLPGTFLICLGVFTVIKEYLKNIKVKAILLTAVSVILILDGVSLSNAIITEKDNSYYDSIRATWDKDYDYIPQKSVVIFSTLDFRSVYYRPDVISGAIDPSDTMDTLKAEYYGSDYMVILKSDAQSMVFEPLYQQDVENAIKEALSASEDNDKYIVIGLR